MLNLLSAMLAPPLLLVGTYVAVSRLRRSVPVSWAVLVIAVQLLAAFLVPPASPTGSGYFVGVPPHLGGVVMAATTALVARPLLVHAGYRIAVAMLATAWWTGSLAVGLLDIAGGESGDLAWFGQLPVVGGISFGVAAGWSLVIGIPLAGEYGSHWDSWPPHRWGSLTVWLGLLGALVAMAPPEHRARAWAVAGSGAVLFLYAVGWCAYLD